MASMNVPITLRYSPPSRDELAAMAMQGLCASLGRDGGPTFDSRKIAKSAYSIADAMLAEAGELPSKHEPTSVPGTGRRETP
jgi:hypothetical protein